MNGLKGDDLLLACLYPTHLTDDPKVSLISIQLTRQDPNPAPSTPSLVVVDAATMNDHAISTKLLANVNSQSQLLTQIFGSVSNPAAIPRLYAALTSTTDDLAELLEEARQHQLAHQAMLKQKAQVLAMEKQVRAMLVTLETGRSELQSLVDQGKETAKVMDRATQGELPTFRNSFQRPSTLRDSWRMLRLLHLILLHLFRHYWVLYPLRSRLTRLKQR